MTRWLKQDVALIKGLAQEVVTVSARATLNFTLYADLSTDKSNKLAANRQTCAFV